MNRAVPERYNLRRRETGRRRARAKSGIYLCLRLRLYHGRLGDQLDVERDQQLYHGIERRAHVCRERSVEALATYPRFARKSRHALGAHHGADRPDDQERILGRQSVIQIFGDRFRIVAVFANIENAGPTHLFFSSSVPAVFKTRFSTLLILRLNAGLIPAEMRLLRANAKVFLSREMGLPHSNIIALGR